MQIAYTLAFIYHLLFKQVSYIKTYYIKYINKQKDKIKLIFDFCKTY